MGESHEDGRRQFFDPLQVPRQDMGQGHQDYESGVHVRFARQVRVGEGRRRLPETSVGRRTRRPGYRPLAASNTPIRSSKTKQATLDRSRTWSLLPPARTIIDRRPLISDGAMPTPAMFRCKWTSLHHAAVEDFHVGQPAGRSRGTSWRYDVTAGGERKPNLDGFATRAIGRNPGPPIQLWRRRREPPAYGLIPASRR